jgi:hypothetical protein
MSLGAAALLQDFVGHDAASARCDDWAPLIDCAAAASRESPAEELPQCRKVKHAHATQAIRPFADKICSRNDTENIENTT